MSDKFFAFEKKLSDLSASVALLSSKAEMDKKISDLSTSVTQLSNKIDRVAIEAADTQVLQISKDESKRQIKEFAADTSNIMKIASDESKKQIKEFVRRSDVYPSERRLCWRINGVRQHVKDKSCVNSNSFEMSIPGKGTYKMKLQARFGRRGGGGCAPIPGNVLGLYIWHDNSDSSFASAMPIHISGSYLELNRDNQQPNKKRIFASDAKIDQSGNGSGWENFCEDIFEGYNGYNILMIEAFVKISSNSSGNFDLWT